jgi:hypothetical protein
MVEVNLAKLGPRAAVIQSAASNHSKGHQKPLSFSQRLTSIPISDTIPSLAIPVLKNKDWQGTGKTLTTLPPKM